MPSASELHVGRAVSSITNGVSQQPPHTRAPGHVDEQVNCISRAVDGVSRRPPFEWLAQLVATLPQGGYFTHIYDRDGSEQYVVLISDNSIRVFDFAGTEAGVTDNSNGYLNFNPVTTQARDLFRAITVADTTFVLNKNVTAAMSGVPTAAQKIEFMLWCKSFGPSSGAGIATMTVGSTTFTFGLDAGNTATTINGFITAFNAAGVPGTWVLTRVGGAGASGASAVHVQKTVGAAPSTIQYSDSDGDSVCELLYRRTQRFSDLPPQGYPDFLIEIAGDGGDVDDNYWVTWDDSESTWVETVAAGIDNEFDADTMPHTLVRTGSMAFTFGPVAWEDRAKGDDISSPEPGFIGSAIRDIVFHKGRLVFLSGETVNAGEKDQFTNWWPTTVTAVIDSDPLEADASSNRVSFLDWGVPFNQQLSLFSARGGVIQELQGVDGIVTPKNSVVVERAAYDNSPFVAPQAVGRSIYFVVDRESTSGIYEYQLVGDIVQADELTAHIPRYLPGKLRLVASSSNENALAYVPENDPSSIYVYSFQDVGSDRIMSAWYRWKLSDATNVLGMTFIGSSLFAVCYRANGPSVFLQKCNLRKVQDADMGFRVHLDSLRSLTGSYTYMTDTTTWTLPFGVDSDECWVAVLGSDSWADRRGEQVALTVSIGSPTVTAVGDFSAHPVLIGHQYLSCLVLSPAIVEVEKGVANANIGRLQLRQTHVAYTRTGYFKARVQYRDEDALNPECRDRTDITTEFTGRSASGYSGIVGPPILQEGAFRIGSPGDARNVRIQLESEAYLPFTLASVEWEGVYIQQTRQV